MSEIRINRIQSPSSVPITISGITTFSGTDAFVVPSGVQTQRPTKLLMGQIRYNSESGYMEYYNGTNWVNI